MNVIIYSVPLAGALLGWMLHKAFIAGLFRKISAAQPVIAVKGGAVAAGQIDLSIITSKVKDPAVLDGLRPYISSHVDQFLQHKLQEKIPVISMFVGQGTLDKIKEGLMEEIDLLLPEVIGRYAGSVVDSINLAQLVADRINAMPAESWNNLLHQALDKPMRQLALFGALSGFITGLLALIMTLSLG